MKTKNIDEFVATYKTSYQISPDDFTVVNPTLKVTKETTVGDILLWFKLHEGAKNPMEIKIIQMTQNKES